MINRYLALGLLACTLAFSSNAQTSLKSLVAENSVEWVFGSWKGEGDNGETGTLDMSWDLDKHLIVLHVKIGDMESKGFTVLEPNQERPSYYSVDNRGSVAKGSWDKENDEMILRVTANSAERGPRKMAFVFSGSPEKGLQVRVHAIDSDGNLEQEPKQTFKFKKQ